MSSDGDVIAVREQIAIVDSNAAVAGVVIARRVNERDDLTTQKRYDEAEPLLVESCESLKNSQGEQNPRTVTARNRLAALYEKWNKP